MRSILVSAYACEPLKGSEQGVGWNWLLQMAKYNYVHVITRANNQVLIEANLPEGLAKNVTFHYYDTHKIIKGLKNKAKGLYFYYFCWQLGIMPLIKKLLKETKFDYSMHLTMGSVWMPTFLPFFNIPFIWGPIGGGDNEPISFSKILPVKQKFTHYFRRILNATVSINPFIGFTSIRAISILCRTENTAQLFPNALQTKIKVVLETAMESEIFNLKVGNEVKRDQNVIRLITTGRLMSSKNIISIIKALKLIDRSFKLHITIIGSGPEKLNILNEAKSLHSNITLELIEEVAREEVLYKLKDSDIYLFPSLREGGSWALMEAMAIGLPVICLKWSGMEIITDEESAIRLSVTNPNQMPIDMAEAIMKLINSSELRLKLGAAGRERIKSVFNWEAKGLFMENLFNELDKAK